MTNLQTRVVSAVALAVPVLALTALGGLWFRIMMALMAAIMLAEWTRMSGRASDFRRFIVPAMGLAVVLVALLADVGPALIFALLAAGVAVTFVDARLRGDGWGLVIGLVYAGLSGVSLALLRGGGEAGLWAILFLFAIVWATDILAYFVGRALGGPKLAPSISPGKTWSGALGGAAGGMLAGIVVLALAGELSVWLALASLLLSIAAQIGDLFESAVKRHYGVKDSGDLIPGHGGLMDRVDGLVAAAFVLYLIAATAGGLHEPARGLFGV